MGSLVGVCGGGGRLVLAVVVVEVGGVFVRLGKVLLKVVWGEKGKERCGFGLESFSLASMSFSRPMA